MGKRKKLRGKSRTHSKPSGTPIEVHEDAGISLYWHRASDMEQEDARGFDSLFYPIGWISDEEDRWQLWFTGNPARSDAIPSNYPFFWDFIEYTDSSSRKKSAALETVSPVVLNPSMPKWLQKEIRLVPELTKKTEEKSKKEQLVQHKRDAWNLGVRTIKGFARPSFRVDDTDKDSVRIKLEPYSTARTLLRVIEQASMHLPKVTMKDSGLEPLLKLTQFLAAMDYQNFGLASSLCAGRYVKAFSIVIPEPYRFLLMPNIIDSAHEEFDRIAPENLTAALDYVTISTWLDKGPDEGFISIQQIAVDLDKDDQAMGATTPRRIADKLDRLGIEIISHEVIGDSISLEDYRKHRTTLLRHGNEKQ